MFDLSVVIVNYNTPDLTLDCVKSIEKNTKNLKYELILVDNALNAKDSIALQNNKTTIIHNKKNLGFTGGNNVGMKKAKGRYLLLLNSDTLIHDNVLAEMVGWLDNNPKIGLATCSLKNKDGSIQATGGFFPTLLRVFSWMTIQDLPFVDRFIKPFHPKSSFYREVTSSAYPQGRELDWVTGAFLLVRREVINQIGYLDEEYFMYTEDTDYCYKAKEKKWKIVYSPVWSITHLGGASSTKEFPILSEYKNVKLFYKKHYPSWQYGILRTLLKLGSLWRMVLISPKTYAKAFREA